MIDWRSPGTISTWGWVLLKLASMLFVVALYVLVIINVVIATFEAWL